MGDGRRQYIIKDSGKREEEPSGAIRDTRSGKGRYDLLPLLALARLAKHYETGAKKYSDRNWEKGMKISRLIDSSIRHLFKFILGNMDGEDHLTASIWNLCGALEILERIDRGILPEELDDLPYILNQDMFITIGGRTAKYDGLSPAELREKEQKEEEKDEKEKTNTTTTGATTGVINDYHDRVLAEGREGHVGIKTPGS